MASALDRTMSLTSVREDGLFTGEEITMKNTRTEQQCKLAVLIEADEHTTYEEDNDVKNITSSIVIVPSVDSSSAAENAEAQSQNGDPQHHEHIEIAISPIQSQEEEEGVDAILIEHGCAPITTETERVSHYIRSQSPPPPLPSQEQRSVSFSFKRNITRKMNRAAHKVKNALGSNASKTQVNVNIDSASSQDIIVSETRDENNRIQLSAPTPRTAQTVEEASSHFDELSVQSTVDATTETPRRKNASNNIMEATKTECETIIKVYDSIDENSDASIEYNIEQSSQIQSNHHMRSNLSKESEQFDPDYQGPYDDNKSLLTHSTGDFSQMYSRSWSTIGNHNVASTNGRISWSRGRSNSPYVGSRDRVVVINESCSQAEDGEFGEDKIMVVPKERRRDDTKEMNGGVSLDGLSLVNSVVGDDRSYVEDY